MNDFEKLFGLFVDLDRSTTTFKFQTIRLKEHKWTRRTKLEKWTEPQPAMYADFGTPRPSRENGLNVQSI